MGQWAQQLLNHPARETAWLVFGFLAQVCFFGRFLVQWIVSEARGESVIPPSFWILSMIGGAMLLAYAIYRKDPVFILGQSMGVLVYARNLTLIHRKHSQNRNREH